jgi:SAM-dependent methyltransferase
MERDALPVPAGHFDAAFSKSVIEHMRDPMRLLYMAFEALRPGGVFVVMTPSWEHQHSGPFYIDHTHVTAFTAPALADALAIAGFVDVDVEHFRQLPVLWRHPYLRPAIGALAALPLSYRPYRSARWPDGLNKLIRFAKEQMLLGIARRPD